MALYKGNKESRQARPAERKSSLIRSRVQPPPTEWPDQGQEEPPQEQAEEEPPEEAPVEPEPPAPESELLEELAPPPAAEPPSRRKVLGGRKKTATNPDLPAYSQTVVIGKVPEPPPPQQTMMDGPQGAPPAAAPAPPPQPQGPPIDQQIIEQAKAQAAQIEQHAQMQAQQMLNELAEQAQAQAQHAHQIAAQEGYEAGMAAGMEAGQQAGIEQSMAYIDHLKIQFIELVQLKRNILAQMEPEVVRLALEIAKKIVGQELETNKEMIVGIVRGGLSTLKERDEITIRVNPQEYDAIKAHQTEFESMIEGLQRFDVLSDGAIEPGSCAIETNMGNVDARISTQFEAIRLALEDMIKIRSHEINEQLSTTPVEVPGDPEFHQRLVEQAQVEQGAHGGHDHHGHGHGHGHGEEDYSEDDEDYEEEEDYDEEVEE